MRFIPAIDIVKKAQQDGYGVPAFNTNGATYSIARAAIEAAKEMRSPLILQAYEPNLAYRGFNYFVRLAESLCDDLSIDIPIALHLDHGHSFASIARALKAGFTSVMIDASDKPIDENIAITNKVAELARIHGASVEAEIGHVKGNEKKAEVKPGRVPIPISPEVMPEKTTIDEIQQFLAGADVDMLAVSIGTTHGVFEKQTTIDFDLLASIRSQVDIPLVQHGTGGIYLSDITKLVKHGMVKINFGEPFRFSYINNFIEQADIACHDWHAWKIDEQVKNILKEEMKAIIVSLGSDKKV